jgi:hypothetical protein
MPNQAGGEQWQRYQDHRNPKRMRQPVHRMLMALRILRDPRFPAASGEHARNTSSIQRPDQLPPPPIHANPETGGWPSLLRFGCSMPQLRSSKWRYARPILKYSPPPVLEMSPFGPLIHRLEDAVTLVHPPAPLRNTKASPIPVPAKPNPGDNKRSNQQYIHSVPLYGV